MEADIVSDVKRDVRPLVVAAERKSPAAAPAVEIRGLNAGYGHSGGAGIRIIHGLDLVVEEGEFLVLLGPSGCGKTTLLRSIAGLHRPESGSISLAGRPVFDGAAHLDTPPERRPLNMMFQSYALFPHMTVGNNVSYPLKFKGLDKAARREKVRAVLASVGLANFEARYPSQLSGGQQQRAALARAIVGGDKTLLFDEPLSNVDVKVRDQLREELLNVQRQLNFTAIYVTHDQEEAMALASRIIVLESGRIAQQGTPEDVYLRPNSLSMARFFGKANEIPAEVVSVSGDQAVVKVPFGSWKIRLADAFTAGEKAVAVSRPEHWRLSSAASSSDPVRWCVAAASFLGMHTQYDVASITDDKPWTLKVYEMGPPRFQIGDEVAIGVDLERLALVQER